MGILAEFREFAFEGDVLDMAVGIVIGIAFGDVVSSFVDDILGPPLGALVGTTHLSELFFTLDAQAYPTAQAARDAGAVVVTYGRFLAAIIDLLLIAFALFFLVRTVNRIRREPEPSTPVKRTCPHCRSEIARAATRCPACTSSLDAEG